MCVSEFLKLVIVNWNKWALNVVFKYQVFSEDLKSNTVFRLFILVWSYEGMKVLDLGYEELWKVLQYSDIWDFHHLFITHMAKNDTWFYTITQNRSYVTCSNGMKLQAAEKCIQIEPITKPKSIYVPFQIFAAFLFASSLPENKTNLLFSSVSRITFLASNLRGEQYGVCFLFSDLKTNLMSGYVRELIPK